MVEGSRTRIGINGRISARAASDFVTIRQYAHKIVRCPNKNPLRFYCFALVAKDFRWIFVFKTAARVSPDKGAKAKKREKTRRKRCVFGPFNYTQNS